MKEGRKLEYPEKTPGDELQKMPHTTVRRFKPRRDSNSHNSIGDRARKADVLTVTPRVAPYLHELAGLRDYYACRNKETK